MAYFKGCIEECSLRIHESSNPNRLSISIDLYNFEGDGKDVCEGLKDCTVIFDDGTTDTGCLFCMCYDPDDVTPLTFMLMPENRHDFDVDPDSVPLSSAEHHRMAGKGYASQAEARAEEYREGHHKPLD